MLEGILSAKREEVEALGRRRRELRAAAESAAPPRDFPSALRRGGEVALIAEVKRRSPSAGWLRRRLEPGQVAEAYAAGGAAAVSVLTDRHHFAGDLADLGAVRRATELPVLRKDFILDAVQLWEARAAGADAILLIVRVLERGRLLELLALARQLGLAALVEAHTAAEVELALGAGAQLLGLNNRDLDTLETDMTRALALAPLVPPDRVLVAESGISSAAQVDALGSSGVDAVLVGESLMRAADGVAAAAALVGRRRVPRAGPRAAPSPGPSLARPWK